MIPFGESNDNAALRRAFLTTAPAPDDVAAEAEPFDGEHEAVSPFAVEPAEAEAHVEPETGEVAVLEPEAQVEVEGWQPMPEAGSWHPVTGADPAPQGWQPVPEVEARSALQGWQPAPCAGGDPRRRHGSRLPRLSRSGAAGVAAGSRG